MTERKYLKSVLKRIGCNILYENDTVIEFESPCLGESICVSFDKEGKIVLIHS